MTEKIYDTDPLILEFDAKVLSCFPSKTEGEYEIILDRTAFFPEEGGQGSDNGTLNGHKVLHVAIDKENTLTHLLSEALPAGSTVHGCIDWATRFDRMQQHTGEHILSGLVNEYFHYNNVGFHLGDTETTLDFDGVLSSEDMLRMEILANEMIWKNLPVQVTFPSKEELDALEYRSKKELDGQVRIVTIPGVDICACCAPHVSLTGQVGQLKITDMQSHRGGVRLTILCGERALKRHQESQQILAGAGAALSAKPEALLSAIERLKEESLSRKERINTLQAALLQYRIAALPSPETSAHAILFTEAMDTKAIRDAVNSLCEKYEGFCAIFTGSDETGYSFILGSRTLDCNIAAQALKDTFSAKCGGSARMIQGSLTASEAAVREALSALK